jgi:hypothetical protein
MHGMKVPYREVSIRTATILTAVPVAVVQITSVKKVFY